MSIGGFDYIIVGGGSAGCVLANRLSVDPETRVLLLEAGGRANYIWAKIPVGYLYCFGNPRVDWNFETEAEDGLNGRKLAYPRGKVLGGCSVINGMIYMRGQARDYDSWAQLGNTGWNWDSILPYFTRSEDNIAVEPEDGMHARGGEWRIEEPRLSWSILDAFREAAAEAGIPKIEDFNRGNNEGCGYFHVNQHRGWRWDAARGFLKPIARRPNLRIVTEAHAAEVLFRDGRACGMTFYRHGKRQTADAGEVILSAGAVASPAILQRSGIGPGALLQEHGIPVIHEGSGVGENLQDHLQIRCAYKVHGIETLNERANRLTGKIGIGLEYLLRRRGPMTMAPSQLGAFAKSDPSFDTPNLQYHVQPLTLEKFGQPLDAFPAFTASVCNLRPESRGQIQINSTDAHAPPVIRPRYLSASRDRQVAADAIRLTRKIVAQPSLQRYQPEEFKPGPEYDTDEVLATVAGDIGTTIFHPVGTCRMGSDSQAVVDARLCVYGVKGLRVVDASVMPTITSGNTNSPTMMIAEKAAEMIREDRRGP